MGQRIECTIRIMAPPAAVWAIIQNTARRREWDARVVEAHCLTNDPPGRGTHFRVTYRLAWLRPWAELEYIVWQPPERSAVRGVRFSRGSLIQTVGGSWHFHDNGDGSTSWTTVVNVRLEAGPLTPLLEGLFVRGTFTRLTEQSQHNLKRLIEQEYVPPPTVAPPAYLSRSWWRA